MRIIKMKIEIKEIKDEDDENIIDTSKEKLKFLNNNKLVSNSVNNDYNKYLTASLIKQIDEDKSINFKDKLIKISKIPIFKIANYMDDKLIHSDSIIPSIESKVIFNNKINIISIISKSNECLYKSILFNLEISVTFTYELKQFITKYIVDKVDEL